MKKAALYLIFIVLITACNTVTTGDYMLTDDNADLFAPKYRYWQSAELDEKGGSILEFRGFKKGRQQKIWLMDSYPKTEKDLPIYIRTKKVAHDKRLIQITSWEDGQREISLVYGKFLNDSSLLLYGYNKALFTTVASSKTLEELQDHITVGNTEVSLDSVAIKDNRSTLLEFLAKELSHPKHFKNDSIVFRGSTQPNF
ncbi:Hypothetical protein I595_3058 [Croceitalea dokdonensis DOKDO 023]|uniref:Lipoprotein n=1 Tax=Croceitalea dokdonensis DOKDO 023 TaxID=1300341 RepID=A0A0P7AXM0_9FLAO|nr:hypothetical protein [Croceitalea dokdonensis]KPM31079.1 Hypothetical protein I595_3058 [Croceitalea dokdonensis DOKDO 023]